MPQICMCVFEKNYDDGDLRLMVVKLTPEEWRHWFEGTEQPLLIWKDYKKKPSSQKLYICYL